MNNDFNKLASEESVGKTVAALKTVNIEAVVVENIEEARKKVAEIIPEGAEVMTMTSETLRATGIVDDINESGKYKSVRKGWEGLDKSKPEDARRMKYEGAVPEWAIGSVHAVTEDGKVMVASNTGSQLAAYVYGANNIVWVVGTQKVVKDKNEGKKRIYEYVLPRESIRLRKAYGLPDTFNSNVSKLLILSKEVIPNRITIIFVNDILGF